MTLEHLEATTDDGVTYETLVISNDAGEPVILVTKQPDGTVTVTDDAGRMIA